MGGGFLYLNSLAARPDFSYRKFSTFFSDIDVNLNRLSLYLSWGFVALHPQEPNLQYRRRISSK